MPAPLESTTDVLVVGAGPAGLTTALGLARSGVSVRVVDISPHKVTVGHADGIANRTAEVFQSYGLGDELLSKANHGYKTCNYSYDPVVGGIKSPGKGSILNTPTARYKVLLTCHQGFIEGLLLSALEDAGVKVERPCKPTGLKLAASEDELADPASHPVEITLEHLSAGPGTHSSEVVRAKMLVGADGAHSWVRRTLDIPMEGDSTARVWGAIDFTPSSSSNFPDWRNGTTITAADVGMLLIPREDDKVRLYIELGTEDELEKDDRGRPDTSVFTPEKMLDIARTAFKPYIFETTLESVEWWTVYTVGQRVAAKFAHHGRVFIAGDASHTHSPKGGQGLNFSVNDGHNLGWKLAHVLKGWSPMALLDTYEGERRPLAQELIAFDKWFAEGFSAKARAKLMEKDPDVVLPAPLEAFYAFSGLLTGLGIHYPPSMITSQTPPVVNDTEGEHSPFALTIGNRITPYNLVRVADSNPVNLHDALPSDGLTKLVVFAGSLTSQSDKDRLADLEKALLEALDKLGRDRFRVVVVLSGISDDMNYLDVPAGLWKDWKSVLVDAESPWSSESGGAYAALGVPTSGQLVVVRPDGYIGAMSALADVERIGEYLGGWMI